MTTALSTMADIETKIKESVKVQFMNLLPDEQFQAMVEAEIKNFFEIKSNKFEIRKGAGHYDPAQLTADVSPFGLIVWKQVSELARKEVADLFASDEFKAKTMLTPIEATDLEGLALSNQQVLAMSMSGNMFKHMIAQSLEASKIDIMHRYPQLIPQY
jgi:hypothetical protein